MKREVLNQLSEGIIVFKNNNIMFCNDSILDILNITNNEAMNGDLEIILEDEAEIQGEGRQLKLLVSGGTSIEAVSTITKDEWDSQECYLAIIKSIKDLSDASSLDNNHNLIEKLKIQTEKNDIFINMLHEFITPMNVLYSGAQLVEDKVNNYIEDYGQIIDFEDIKKYANNVKHNVERLQRLSDNMLQACSMVNNTSDISLVNYDIVKIVEDITQSVARYIKNSNTHIIFDTELEELKMAMDMRKIETIMYNLLSNAKKFTENNGRIEVNIKKVEDNVEIQVADNGVGIPEDKQDKIFERFVKAENTLCRRAEGLGMGLNLVKNYVSQLHGNIDVESSINKGSVFTVTLPIVKADKDYDNILDEEHYDYRCKVEFSDIYDI